MKLTSKRRRRNLNRAIQLAYGSLKTHLAAAESNHHPAFDAGAIREYGEIILICAQESEILAREFENRRAMNKNLK